MIWDVHKDLSRRRKRIAIIIFAAILIAGDCGHSINVTIVLALRELICKHGSVKSLGLFHLLIPTTWGCNGLHESSMLGRGQGLVVLIV